MNSINISQLLEFVKELGYWIINNTNFSNLLIDNKQGLVIGIIVATTIFILKGNKQVKNLSNSIRYKNKNSELLDRINTTMRKRNVSYEKAKQLILTEELLNGLRVSKPSWLLKDDRLIYQGQRISFYDKEIGYIKGDFLGIINPDIDGYDDLYVVRLIKDNSIRQSPISFVEEDTIQVFF